MSEYCSYTYNRGKELSDKEIQQMGEAQAELNRKPHILDLEDFAFSLLNQLADEYNIHDYDGSVTRAIWDENTPEGMQKIIDQLQAQLLEAMRIKAESFRLF
jgi:hypothetical protein